MSKSNRRLVMHGSDRLTQAEAAYIIAMIDENEPHNVDFPPYIKIGKPLRKRLNDLLLQAQSPSLIAHWADKMRDAEKSSRPKRRRPTPPQPIQFPSGEPHAP